MPDELLTIFKICFLVLLYLFFFRVLRAVWTEVNAAPAGTDAPPQKAPKATRSARKQASAPVPAATAPPAQPTGPTKLVAVDPPHLANIEYPLSNGMTVGRGGDSTIVLEDSFLSTHHAAFERREGDWVVADEGSTNGTYVNNVKVDQIARLHVGDRVQLGNVILEVR